MPKDFNKYLTTSLKVYIFVLACIFIMKLIGLDYFGLSVENNEIIKISDFLVKTHIADLINCIVIFIQYYCYLCVVCDKKGMIVPAIIGAGVNIITQIILVYFCKMNNFYTIISILILIITPKIIDRKVKITKIIKYVLLLTIYQAVSLFIRNINVNNNFGNFIIDFVLNIDQLLLIIITYKIYFMKRDGKLCGLEQEAGFSLLKKIHLKRLPKQLQKNLHNFKAKPKQERITIVIYILLSALWNSLTVVIILIVAKLNGTLIECIFIASSFWLSKHSFGKPFHLASMTKCFILSNVSYYVLNRITTPLGISVFVPVLLGVGLSYATSKLVKKTYKALYKGMPKELFEETILKVADKNSQKYKICYEFYINGKSDLSLSFQYNYSIAGIRKIKSRINDEIRRLQ